MNLFRATERAILLLAGCLFAGLGQAENLLRNGDFEDSDTRPEQWLTTQHAGALAYEFVIDATDSANARNSLRVTRTQQQIYGLVSQGVDLPKAVGPRRLRFSAWMKTREVGDKGWMLMINFNRSRAVIIEQVRSRPLSGTNDWQLVQIEQDLPEKTTSVTAGAMLLAEGSGWVDAMDLQVVDAGESFPSLPTPKRSEPDSPEADNATSEPIGEAEAQDCPPPTKGRGYSPEKLKLDCGD